MTEQEQIRAEYEEIDADLREAEEAVATAEDALLALQERCAHPNIGKGIKPGTFTFRVEPNECPDCGYLKEPNTEDQKRGEG